MEAAYGIEMGASDERQSYAQAIPQERHWLCTTHFLKNKLRRAHELQTITAGGPIDKAGSANVTLIFESFRRSPTFSSTPMKPSIYPGIAPEDDTDIEVVYPDETVTTAGLWSEIKSITRDIIFAAVMAVLIVVFVVQPVKVEGTSMQPRLENEERIFVNKFKYNFEPIQRGDIIVFWFPDDPSKSFIKRIIGLPGERIDMDALGRVTINGVPLDESYLAPERNQMARARWASVREDWKSIKQHYYFVMGDNRDMSNDSRSWGLVPEKYIYGKAMFRYWPLQRMGSLDSTADYDPEQQ
jgi:signal peptidase I